MAKRVDWTDSPIDLFRTSVVDLLTAALPDDYQISDTWDNIQVPAVVIVGNGWTPPSTGCETRYGLSIFTLYMSQDKRPEAGAEEMMRRVWVALAYESEDNPGVDLDAVRAIAISLGEEPNVQRFQGMQLNINKSLQLAVVEEE